MIQTIGYKFEENRNLTPVIEHQRQREIELHMRPVKVKDHPRTFILPPADIPPEVALKRHLEGNELYQKNVFIKEYEDEIYY